MKKLPFKLETLEADRAFIPVYPENKQWLVVLKDTELGDKLCNLLEPSLEDENTVGLWLDKIYGLYQEERQLLEQQIEDYYNEKLQFQKFIAKVAKVLGRDNDEIIELLDDPYKDGLEQGEKLEPFLTDFRELALKLTKLESRLNEDAIAVVMRKRFKIDWSKEETEQLHEGMKKALSDFINNEQKGWDKKVEGRKEKVESNSDSELSTSYSLLSTSSEGKPSDTPNPTGSASTTTSTPGQTTPDSAT